MRVFFYLIVSLFFIHAPEPELVFKNDTDSIVKMILVDGVLKIKEEEVMKVINFADHVVVEESHDPIEHVAIKIENTESYNDSINEISIMPSFILWKIKIDKITYFLQALSSKIYCTDFVEKLKFKINCEFDKTMLGDNAIFVHFCEDFFEKESLPCEVLKTVRFAYTFNGLACFLLFDKNISALIIDYDVKQINGNIWAIYGKNEVIIFDQTYQAPSELKELKSKELPKSISKKLYDENAFLSSNEIQDIKNIFVNQLNSLFNLGNDASYFLTLRGFFEFGYDYCIDDESYPAVKLLEDIFYSTVTYPKTKCNVVYTYNKSLDQLKKEIALCKKEEEIIVVADWSFSKYCFAKKNWIVETLINDLDLTNKTVCFLVDTHHDFDIKGKGVRVCSNQKQPKPEGCCSVS